MFVLAAAQPQEVALEATSLGHGLLTYALLRDGLRGMKADRRPQDGRLTLAELLDYALEHVPRLRREVEGRRRVPKLSQEDSVVQQTVSAASQQPGRFNFAGESLEEVELISGR